MPPLTALERLDILIDEMGRTAWPQEHWRGEFVVLRHVLANDLQSLVGQIGNLTTERDMALRGEAIPLDDPQLAPPLDDVTDALTTNDDHA